MAGPSPSVPRPMTASTTHASRVGHDGHVGHAHRELRGRQNSGPGTLTIHVNGAAATNLSAITAAFAIGTAPANVSSAFQLLSPPRQRHRAIRPDHGWQRGPARSYSNGSASITDASGNTISIGVTGKTQGASANGMQIKIVQGAAGTAATSATFDSTATATRVCSRSPWPPTSRSRRRTSRAQFQP